MNQKQSSRLFYGFNIIFFFLKGPTPASFCLFSFFSHNKYITNTINDKSIDGCDLATQGGRMVRTYKSTELWRPAPRYFFVSTPNFYLFNGLYGLFLFLSSLQTVHNKLWYIKGADDWIQTQVLWYRMRLRCQLWRNHFPNV